MTGQPLFYPGMFFSIFVCRPGRLKQCTGTLFNVYRFRVCSLLFRRSYANGLKISFANCIYGLAHELDPTIDAQKVTFRGACFWCSLFFCPAARGSLSASVVAKDVCTGCVGS